MKNTSSQYKGVYLYTDKIHWYAHIKVNKKLIWLGSYKSEIEAAKAYDKAALKYFGEFARLNFPDEAGGHEKKRGKGLVRDGFFCRIKGLFEM